MRRKSGFTLLELLIVIIIIGLLAAIGMVQYAKAVANTKNSQAKQVLGEMRKAALAYHSINGNWPAAGNGCQNINVDLDGDGTNDVTFATPSTADFTFSCPAQGQGRATKTGAAGSGVSTWTIDFSNGSLTAS